MEAFKTNKTLKGENEALKANLLDMENNASELHDNFEAAKASIIEKDQAIATLQADNAKLVEDSAKHIADLASANIKLEESKGETEKAESSAMAKAKDIAASAGHESKVLPEEEDSSQETLHTKYRALQASNPAAATKFWNDNKDQLTN